MSTRKNKNPCIHRSFINVKSLLWLHVTCQYITVFCLRLQFTVISQLFSLCRDLVEVVKKIVKKNKFFLGTSSGPRYSKSVKYWTRVYSHVLYWSRGVKYVVKYPHSLKLSGRWLPPAQLAHSFSLQFEWLRYAIWTRPTRPYIFFFFFQHIPVS